MEDSSEKLHVAKHDIARQLLLSKLAGIFSAMAILF